LARTKTPKFHLWGEGKAAGNPWPTALLSGAIAERRRSLDEVHLAKPKSLYKRPTYPPPAIQNRTDNCAINAIVICKSDLASLAFNCDSQQTNNVFFVKNKSIAAPIDGQSSRTSFVVGICL